MKALAAFASGLLFALGLGISGMVSPDKVLGFLDIGHAWDPSLAFVMAGALAVYSLAQWRILKRAQPVFDGRFHLPDAKTVDARLVGGAAIFGLGWGLSGICPGPALMLLATGRLGVLVFFAGMLGGAWIVRGVRAPAAESPPITHLTN